MNEQNVSLNNEMIAALKPLHGTHNVDSLRNDLLKHKIFPDTFTLSYIKQ